MDSEDLAAALKRRIAQARSGAQANEYQRLAWAKVDKRRITGNTRHYGGNLPLPAPESVEIVKVGTAEGYYLLYLNGEGKELTDTFHETMEQAVEQAHFEFGLLAWEHS